MKQDDIIEDIIGEKKIYVALNSLARFLDFKESNAPEIMIRQEKRLLSRYFGSLSHEEFNKAAEMWPIFYRDRRFSLELEAQIIQENFEKQALYLS